MSWWLWMLLGMALTILELQMPGSFFLLGFGLSAVVIGFATGAGIGGPPSLQWLLFSVLAIGNILVLRKLFGVGDSTGLGAGTVNTLVGAEAVITEDVSVGGVGKAELRGTTWTARNAGEVALIKGQRCQVVRIEGLALWLRSA
jgi:membrane protein implicated in regulation of membrane protease activity